MRAYPLIERVLPFLFAETHTHRDLVIELDCLVRLERQRAPGRTLCMPAGEESGDRSPQDPEVDLAGRQVALDHVGRVLRRIAALRRVENGMVEHLVSQQPIRSGRTAEDADSQGMQPLRR